MRQPPVGFGYDLAKPHYPEAEKLGTIEANGEYTEHAR
jgi:hypothetical protein